MTEVDLPAVLPSEVLSPYAALLYRGRSVISVRENMTLTGFGHNAAIPVEPPIKIPAAALVVMGESEGDFCGLGFSTTFAVYVDGLRMHLYKFADGQFVPVEVVPSGSPRLPGGEVEP